MPANAGGVKTSGLGPLIFILLFLFYFALTSSTLKTPAAPVLPQATGTSTTPETGPVFVNITNPNVKKPIVHILEKDQTDTIDQNILSLPVCSSGQHISVWAPGYYILTFPCVDNLSVPYTVQLEPIIANDNPNYSWIEADFHPNQPRDCASCHAGSLAGSLNEYPEWINDGHSRAFTNPYFWTTYMGIDMNWHQSQQIQWSILGNGQKIYPLLDPIQPDYGAGYRLDYPISNGNCAACHVPAGSPGILQEMDIAGLINGSRGSHISAATEGVTCDVCHKVTEVLVEKNSKLPYDDRPGVLSMSFLRPISDQQFNYGPLAYQSILGMNAKTTCFPIYSESKFCAACHYGKFANTLVYGSYKEWLDSSYSKPENPNYRTCQDCHMLDETQITNTLPNERAACSEANVKFSNFSHNMMKYGSDPENPPRQIPLLVKDAAQLKLEPVLSAGQINIKVTVQSIGVGHKFPTDSPLRHLILLVEAIDGRGNRLTQSGGPMVPVWAVPDYGGYPGQIFANIFKDKDTNLAPSFAYWNPVETGWDGADTRLVPGVPVQNTYSFAAPYDGSATITAKLIYRKAFLNVATKKGWPLDNLDVQVTQAVMDCTGFGADPQTITCNPVTSTPTP
ncbi:MAG TPA: hypothetical protein VK206_19950 [Anaerolineales bacterium]|nr:hypothetical protein [Anaerolineales bacterium]